MKGQALKISLTLTAVCFLLYISCLREDHTSSNELLVGEGSRSQVLFDFNWYFHHLFNNVLKLLNSN